MCVLYKSLNKKGMCNNKSNELVQTLDRCEGEEWIIGVEM